MNEETLFELALNTPPAELPALLDRECANNPALRKRIERLLAAHLASDVTPERPAHLTVGELQDLLDRVYAGYPNSGSDRRVDPGR